MLSAESTLRQSVAMTDDGADTALGSDDEIFEMDELLGGTRTSFMSGALRELESEWKESPRGGGAKKGSRTTSPLSPQDPSFSSRFAKLARSDSKHSFARRVTLVPPVLHPHPNSHSAPFRRFRFVAFAVSCMVRCIQDLQNFALSPYTCENSKTVRIILHLVRHCEPGASTGIAYLSNLARKFCSNVIGANVFASAEHVRALLELFLKVATDPDPTPSLRQVRGDATEMLKAVLSLEKGVASFEAIGGDTIVASALHSAPVSVLELLRVYNVRATQMLSGPCLSALRLGVELLVTRGATGAVADLVSVVEASLRLHGSMKRVYSQGSKQLSTLSSLSKTVGPGAADDEEVNEELRSNEEGDGAGGRYVYSFTSSSSFAASPDAPSSERRFLTGLPVPRSSSNFLLSSNRLDLAREVLDSVVGILVAGLASIAIDVDEDEVEKGNGGKENKNIFCVAAAEASWALMERLELCDQLSVVSTQIMLPLLVALSRISRMPLHAAVSPRSPRILKDAPSGPALNELVARLAESLTHVVSEAPAELFVDMFFGKSNGAREQHVRSREVIVDGLVALLQAGQNAAHSNFSSSPLEASSRSSAAPFGAAAVDASINCSKAALHAIRRLVEVQQSESRKALNEQPTEGLDDAVEALTIGETDTDGGIFPRLRAELLSSTALFESVPFLTCSTILDLLTKVGPLQPVPPTSTEARCLFRLLQRCVALEEEVCTCVLKIIDRFASMPKTMGSSISSALVAATAQEGPSLSGPSPTADAPDRFADSLRLTLDYQQQQQQLAEGIGLYFLSNVPELSASTEEFCGESIIDDRHHHHHHHHHLARSVAKPSELSPTAVSSTAPPVTSNIVAQSLGDVLMCLMERSSPTVLLGTPCGELLTKLLTQAILLQQSSSVETTAGDLKRGVTVSRLLHLALHTTSARMASKESLLAITLLLLQNREEEGMLASSVASPTASVDRRRFERRSSRAVAERDDSLPGALSLVLQIIAGCVSESHVMLQAHCCNAVSALTNLLPPTPPASSSSPPLVSTGLTEEVFVRIALAMTAATLILRPNIAASTLPFLLCLESLFRLDSKAAKAAFQQSGISTRLSFVLGTVSSATAVAAHLCFAIALVSDVAADATHLKKQPVVCLFFDQLCMHSQEYQKGQIQASPSPTAAAAVRRVASESHIMRRRSKAQPLDESSERRLASFKEIFIPATALTTVATFWQDVTDFADIERKKAREEVEALASRFTDMEAALDASRLALESSELKSYRQLVDAQALAETAARQEIIAEEAAASLSRLYDSHRSLANLVAVETAARVEVEGMSRVAHLERHELEARCRLEDDVVQRTAAIVTEMRRGARSGEEHAASRAQLLGLENNARRDLYVRQAEAFTTLVRQCLSKAAAQACSVRRGKGMSDEVQMIALSELCASSVASFVAESLYAKVCVSDLFCGFMKDQLNVCESVGFLTARSHICWAESLERRLLLRDELGALEREQLRFEHSEASSRLNHENKKHAERTIISSLEWHRAVGELLQQERDGRCDVVQEAFFFSSSLLLAGLASLSRAARAAGWEEGSAAATRVEGAAREKADAFHRQQVQELQEQMIKLNEERAAERAKAASSKLLFDEQVDEIRRNAAAEMSSHHLREIKLIKSISQARIDDAQREMARCQQLCAEAKEKLVHAEERASAQRIAGESQIGALREQLHRAQTAAAESNIKREREAAAWRETLQNRPEPSTQLAKASSVGKIEVEKVDYEGRIVQQLRTRYDAELESVKRQHALEMQRLEQQLEDAAAAGQRMDAEHHEALRLLNDELREARLELSTTWQKSHRVIARPQSSGTRTAAQRSASPAVEPQQHLNRTVPAGLSNSRSYDSSGSALFAVAQVDPLAAREYARDLEKRVNGLEREREVLKKRAAMLTARVEMLKHSVQSDANHSPGRSPLRGTAVSIVPKLLSEPPLAVMVSSPSSQRQPVTRPASAPGFVSSVKKAVHEGSVISAVTSPAVEVVTDHHEAGAGFASSQPLIALRRASELALLFEQALDAQQAAFESELRRLQMACSDPIEGAPTRKARPVPRRTDRNPHDSSSNSKNEILSEAERLATFWGSEPGGGGGREFSSDLVRALAKAQELMKIEEPRSAHREAAHQPLLLPGNEFIVPARSCDGRAHPFAYDSRTDPHLQKFFTVIEQRGSKTRKKETSPAVI
jgi:hypothetical protein